MSKNAAIVLAGGAGTRTGDSTPKQFLEIDGKVLLGYSLDMFESHPEIDETVVVVHRDFLNFTRDFVNKKSYLKVRHILEGGTTRQESSRIGVMSIGEMYSNVLIHDAARPFITIKIIDEILSRLRDNDAVTTGEPVCDTIVSFDRDRNINGFVDREFLAGIQTPQGFKRDIILEAHRRAVEMGIKNATDDCSLVVTCQLCAVRVVPGSPYNIKITTAKDILIAPQILKQVRGEEG